MTRVLGLILYINSMIITFCTIKNRKKYKKNYSEIPKYTVLTALHWVIMGGQVVSEKELKEEGEGMQVMGLSVFNKSAISWMVKALSRSQTTSPLSLGNDYWLSGID